MIFQMCAGAKSLRKWFVTMAAAICLREHHDGKWAHLFLEFHVDDHNVFMIKCNGDANMPAVWREYQCEKRGRGKTLDQKWSGQMYIQAIYTKKHHNGTYSIPT